MALFEGLFFPFAWFSVAIIRADMMGMDMDAMPRMNSGSGAGNLIDSSTPAILFPIRAVATLTTPRSSGLRGEVRFIQASLQSGVQATGNITGLPPNTLHAFDIHQNGILSDDCDSAGDHFNPNFVPGRPAAAGPMHMDMSMEMGNMGDIRADGAGSVQLNITNTRISLFGRNNVIGRTIIVHESVHDATGEAGRRWACGVIGVLLD